MGRQKIQHESAPPMIKRSKPDKEPPPASSVIPPKEKALPEEQSCEPGCEECVEWELPSFSVDAELVELHNTLADKHEGHKILWQQSNNIKTLVAVAKQFNDTITEKINPYIKDGSYKDVPQAIEGVVKSYASAMLFHIREIYSGLDSAMIRAYSHGQSSGFIEPAAVEMVNKLIRLGVISKPTKKVLESKEGAKTFLSLHHNIRRTFAINEAEPFNTAYPDKVRDIKIMESYIEAYQRLISSYTAMLKYEYLGPVPEPEKPDFPGSDEAPEVVNWSTENHRVEV